MIKIRQFIKSAMNHFVPNRFVLVAGSKNRNELVLTFDDGPDPKTTLEILEALDQLEVKATFFILGENAVRHPEVVQEIANRGHDLGSHTYSHPRRQEISRKEWKDEMRRTDEILKSILGYTTRFFRPPYGKLSFWDLIDLWRNGKTIVLWTQDPKDFMKKSKDITQWFSERKFHPGDVFLLHDTSTSTAHVLPYILKFLRSNSFEISCCSKLIDLDWKSNQMFQCG